MSAHLQRLTASVAVFRELGWHDADPAQAAALPLGDAAQRRTALAGLRSGEWTEEGVGAGGRFGHHDATGVDHRLLTLFALRQGVSARRFTELLNDEDPAIVAPLVLERGDAFTRDVVASICRADNRWMGVHEAVMDSDLALMLVQASNMPVPESVEYLTDFFAHAADRLDGGREVFTASVGRRSRRTKRGAVATAVLQPRFAEHARLAVDLAMPVTGSLLPALRGAIAAGWLTHDEVRELAFVGVESARRPGDRKAWAGFLHDPLQVQAADIVARADALVPLLAGGESAMVEAFGPVLIAGVTDDQLPDVALAALAATTTKGRRAVLDALARRARPDDGESADLIGSIIAPWAAGRDRALAKAAATLAAAWALDATEPEFESSADIDDVMRWTPTPPLWESPAVILGEPSAEALRMALVALDGSLTPDLEGEVFLAQLNALAAVDPEAARRECATLPSGVYEFSLARHWATGEPGPERWEPPTAVLDRRDQAVAAEPGRVPVLLSTPSRVDMSISAADLAARLEIYAAGGHTATEADIVVALLRLDHESVTDDIAARLAAADVAVIRADGKDAGYSAGRLAAEHLGDPVIEPGWLARGKSGGYERQRYEKPASLRRVHQALAEGGKRGRQEDRFTLHPFWGDALHASLGYRSAAREPWIWRQVARRRTPLTPGLAMNLLAVQRATTERGAEDRHIALRDAWERGLLRPGVADIRLLEWQYEPDRLGALATALLDAAREVGIASVVWPLLDDCLVRAGAASRLLAGAAELAEAMLALTPVAVAAVRDGVADASVLAVPGLRALAARSGSSRAVVSARDAVAALAAAEATPVSTNEPRGTTNEPSGTTNEPSGTTNEPSVAPNVPIAVRLSDEEFAAGWDIDRADPEVLEDGVRVHPAMSTDAVSRLLVGLALPDEPGVIYRVDNDGFFRDLEYRHAVQALRLDADGDLGRAVPLGGRELRKMSWDADAARLAALKYAPKGDKPPLPQSLATLVMALLSRDGRLGEAAVAAAVDLAQAGELGARRVERAMTDLVGQDAIDLGRLVKNAMAYPGLLSTFWPALTVSISWAATQDGPAPRWLSSVIGLALDRAPVLREATARGLMPATWPGLDALADRSGKQAAVLKARALRAALAGEPVTR